MTRDERIWKVRECGRSVLALASAEQRKKKEKKNLLPECPRIFNRTLH